MTQKECAIKAMEILGIHKPYIRSFKSKNRVCFFEGFGGYWVNPKSELGKKKRELEKEWGCKVYAITHERTDFGECYSFLIVSKYEEDWNMTLEELKYGYAFAYVWNKTCDWCSEFGTIAVISHGGGIIRKA